MNTDDFMVLLRKEHSVKLTGAFILYLTNTLRDKQLAIMAAQEAAAEDGRLDNLEELDQLGLANEVVGTAFFEIIEQVFGQEFLDYLFEGRDGDRRFGGCQSRNQLMFGILFVLAVATIYFIER